MKSLLETLLLGQLIMASIFGFYMQNVETDVTCVVQGNSYKPLTLDEFDDAKTSAMNIIKLYELKIRKRIFPNITYVRWLNDLLAIVAMIKLHIYRLSHPGKVCSGSFMLDDDNSENYLISRGIILKPR
eukprot:403342782